MLDKPPYTPGMREVLKLSKFEASRLGHDYIGPEHYLLGIIRKGDGLAVQTLHTLDIDLDELKREIENNLQIGKGSSVGLVQPNLESKRVLETTRMIAMEMKHGWIGTEHLLLGLIKEEGTLPSQLLRRMGVDFERAQREVLNVIEGSNAGVKPKSQSQSGPYEKSKTPALDTFGRDLTQLAREGKLDPLIGREKEIERILQILCRRTKNNPILLGEPGVGKTAIVEGLAQKIVSGDIPELLADKRVLSLDLAAVVAGTKYRGQFEERLKAIMQEIRRSQDVLLFIDELHTLIGAGAAEGAIDASNMLKPALSRGELQCIGATTLEEYRKYVERDGALERRFQTIIVNPPTPEETILILKGLRNRYESHHNVVIGDDAIEAAVSLSDRYITDRWLPDKAIDVMDEAGARARLQANVKPPELKEIETRVREIEEEIRARSLRQEFERCQELKRQKEALLERRQRLLDEWKKRAASDEFKPVIGAEDIAHIVSKWTGIPVSRLEEEETQKLLRMEEELHKRVVSQDDAIRAIAKAIRRARAGLKDPRRPTGSFIFLGPTGVGKTLLAKALAEFLFGDENALIRIDMSEYMEKFAVSRLVGAPPGYVGYEEGGQLTEKVRQKPYSVVLLDEIEKAHPDVFSILLQVFDAGRLTDSWGHVVDFRNTVVIMTSNVGTRRLRKGGAMGFVAGDEMQDYDKIKSRVMSEVKKLFSPEFLNRIDDLIVFKSLTRDDITRIVDIEMGEMMRRLAEKRIRLHLTPQARDFLVEKGYDSEYGARPMRRCIQRYVEDPLSHQILEGEISAGDEVELDVGGDELVFRVLNDEASPAAESVAGDPVASAT
ncbi:MAG: ATP-dependent Clp protease ATP-binding subunit [Candidatus Sumerlaeia bacterium]|nr:ATP-dependent Clp protease ATP-binding subunit [Candidatus Sumerlaeia bacterium]